MLRLDRTKKTALTAVLACIFGLLLVAGPADGATRALAPAGSKVFFGVTDTGEIDGFRDFKAATGRKPAVIQTFHSWGNTLSKALPRWRKAKARPMLHITTKADDGAELITPLQIANGRGDDYLIRLNRTLSKNRILTYIRPMGEPNRCLNYYSGVDCAGNIRGGHYSFGYYKAAFRRIATVVRGGGSRTKINSRLRALGLPKLQITGDAKRLPRKFPAAPVSIIWSPLPAGSPTVRQNFPGHYWPGRKWADWVATDFYNRYNNWKHLKRFYIRWAVRMKRPMALTEWGLWGSDDPKFVRQLFTFVKRRDRMKMMVYYQDFGCCNVFRLQNFPRSLGVVRSQIDSPKFPQMAPRSPRPGMGNYYPGLIPR